MGRRKYFLWILLSVVCFGGCIAGRKNTTPEAMKNDIQSKTGIMSLSPEFLGGRLITLQSTSGDSQVVCFDYESKSFVPLCTKADCSHTPGDRGCTANLLAQNLSQICVYDGKLWYLKMKAGDSLQETETVLCCADITGENEEEMYTIEGDIYLIWCSVLYDNSFYGVNHQMVIDEKGLFDGYKERMIRLDLANGEMTEIEGIQHVQSANYYIFGYRDEKIYYRYYPCDEYPEGAIVTYHCETQEKEILSLREGMLENPSMNENYLVYAIMEENENIWYVIDLEKEEEIGFVADKFKRGCSIYDDEILFYSLEQGYSRYQIKTGEYQEKIQNNEFAKQFDAFYSVKDGYLGRIIEDGYETEYAYISKKDFDKGGTPTILTKNGMPIW